MVYPSFEPTDAMRAQVETMTGYGIRAEDVARSLGISEPTLRKYFRNELDLGHIKANAAVAQSLYRKAMGDGQGAVTAAIFWLKTRAGWSEAPQDVNVTVRDDQRSADERARALALMMAKRGQEREDGRPH